MYIWGGIIYTAATVCLSVSFVLFVAFNVWCFPIHFVTYLPFYLVTCAYSLRMDEWKGGRRRIKHRI